jgi:hypothetical protein
VVAGCSVAAPPVDERRQPIPAVCKAVVPPIRSREAAVCAVIERLGRDQLDNYPYEYDARETVAGDWHVNIIPRTVNMLGGDYSADVDGESGVVDNLLRGQ